MKWKALIIVILIIISLFPAYLLFKYLQKTIRPRDSMTRLFLYLFGGFVLVFIYTFILVYLIKRLFPGA